MDTPFIVKLVLVLLLLVIMVNLGRALLIMIKGENKQPMSRYLGRRLWFSVLVILLRLLAFGTGLLTPHPTPY
ncbi:MAG: DUF2909 domain-containing protein [Shewanella sp.]